jgi:outer membrane lipase/esterase
MRHNLIAGSKAWRKINNGGLTMRKAHLLAATALLTLAAAHAASAGSLYAFGDSLSDNGNLFKLVGDPAPPYYKGHFSNGPIWDEYLPGLTGLGFTASQDYAVGGAFTGTLVVNGTNYGTNLGASFLPGVTTEIAEFTAGGGHFNKSDVVTLWAGANNYFFYAGLVEDDPAEAVSLVTSGVSTTISQLTADTNALISLGAHTLIVPNLPNLGSTPDYNTSALGTELGDAFTTLHNQYLPVQMAALHNATGANIIVLDDQLLLATAIANPAAYGFANVTQACIDVAACVDGSTATQNTYLFWDGVHPTTHAQFLVAEYAADALKGFESLDVPARLGTTDTQDFAALLGSRMETLRAAGTGFTYVVPSANPGSPDASTDPLQKLSIYVTGGGSFGYRNDTATTTGFTDSSTAVAAGADYAFTPALRAGLAIGLTQGHADVSEGGTVNDNAANFGVDALATQGPLYEEVSGAYGDHWYDIKHPAVFGSPIQGKPKGAGYSANLTAGYVVPLCPSLSLTPSAGISYTNVSLQGYAEYGDPILTQSVDDQGYQQVLGQAGLEAASSRLFGTTRIATYLSADMQARLSGKNSNFDSSFSSEPGVPLTTTYPTEPAAWALLGAGFSASITPNFFASAALSATAFKSNGNDLTISGAANWSF